MHSGSAVPAPVPLPSCPVERKKSSPERFVVIQSSSEWDLAAGLGRAAAQSITVLQERTWMLLQNFQQNQSQKCCDCAEQVNVLA